jgi:thermitase
MVSNQLFDILTQIKRYVRIITISCIIPLSIFGSRVSINPASAEEFLAAEENLPEVSVGEVLIEPNLLAEEPSRNTVLPSNTPALPEQVIYRVKDNAKLLALSTAQVANLLGNSNNPVERIQPLLAQGLLVNFTERELAPLARTFVVTLSPTADIDNTIQTLSQLPFVEYAERDPLVQVNYMPNDPYCEWQWNLDQSNDADIDALEAWDISTARWIRIAILDTGVEAQHTDFKKLGPGRNFTSNDPSQWNDGHGHGTHVAGIAAAKTNNRTGVAGVCWGRGNCQIMPVKVLTDQGWGYHSWIVNGIVYAVKKYARVINLSLGGTTNSQTLHEAIQYAYNKNITIVAAAGNNGGAVLYPAAYPETIAVAATNRKDKIPWWSSWGKQIDLAAPGVSILSTYRNNSFAWKSGTSMAATHVTGAAALLQSIYRRTHKKFLKPEQVRCYLQESADDLGLHLHEQGAGRLNLKQLLQLVVDPSFVTCNI